MVVAELINLGKAHDFALLAQGLSYPLFFVLALLAGYVLPLPEEVALLIIGYSAGMTPAKLSISFVISLVAVLIGDNVLYLLALHGNKWTRGILEKMKKRSLDKYEHLIHDHIGKTIFFIRFIVGFRSFGPILAGTAGITWRKFFFFNTAASILHVALFISLGFFFRHSFLLLITEVEVVRHVLFFFSAGLFGIMIAIFSQKKFFK